MLTERSKATGQKDGENPNDNILKQLSSQLDEDEATGGKIEAELAQIAEKRWGKSLAPAKIKALADKYKCPENCPSIRGTKVNTEIWTQLNSHKRSGDLALSNMQQTIRKVINANLQVTNLVLESPTGKPNKKIFEPQIESLAMLSHVHNQITQFRREQLKPALRAEYNTICSADIPAKSEYFFGDDLAKTPRDAKEVSRVGKALSTSHKGPQKTYGHSSGSRDSYKGKKDFLWRGQKPYKKKKQQSGQRK